MFLNQRKSKSNDNHVFKVVVENGTAYVFDLKVTVLLIIINKVNIQKDFEVFGEVNKDINLHNKITHEKIENVQDNSDNGRKPGK